ncbi:flavodoxin domain-containing protein [Allorhodopirellula solitaria]|uniref:Sulfite reductase [NADPH] flavoprotein alpha-component n=1 Tax=Allorhodopirellula solitaria TaxID=2527987 RepID=A0A5C5XSR0_9BACT|nr:flavodoxin domain-containing protein [Allorhodopirellula solitaria]TWT64742.1 Sulfite reductase [NADPH] flavoprotein alpha-component [Allorhodopirellula solitaria]
MMNCCSLPTKTTLASVLAGVVVAIAALLCLWWTPGDWWPASPLPSRLYWAAGVGAAYLLLAGWAWRNSAQRQTRAQTPTPHVAPRSDSVLVVYASETGFAESLAHQTHDHLQQRGTPVHLAPIDAITSEQLVAAKQALFIASTAGQGDPPDHAMEFSESLMQQSLSLRELKFGVLALGDRSYDEYCAFGHDITTWLRGCGAETLFDIIEVDDGDPEALQHWESRVASVS